MYKRIYQPILLSIPLVLGSWFNFPDISFAQTIEPEQATLNAGKPVLTGQDGRYIGKILINASAEKAWEVLTDYSHFSKFLPSVTSVKILESKGNQKVYEQVNTIQVLFFTQTSKVTIAATETIPSLITFQLQSGDSLKSLQGSWQIEPISTNQILVTNQVNVEPIASMPRDIFFGIYSENLTKTLAALKQETERRSQGK
jgi:ribosome-associated toxin RatA of RatAB toxin-antitoxin module